MDKASSHDEKNVHMIYLVISMTNVIKNIFYKGQLLSCFCAGVCVSCAQLSSSSAACVVSV